MVALQQLAYAYAFVALGAALGALPLALATARVGARAIGSPYVTVGFYIGALASLTFRAAVWPAVLLVGLKKSLARDAQPKAPPAFATIYGLDGRPRFGLETDLIDCVVCGDRQAALVLASDSEPCLFSMPDGWFASEDGVHVCSTRCAARLKLPALQATEPGEQSEENEGNEQSEGEGTDG